MFSKLNSTARLKPELETPDKHLPKPVPAEAKVTPGQYLKAVRERLQIGMRDVQDASMVIATEEGNDNFYVSPARLTQIETKNLSPASISFSAFALYMGLTSMTFWDGTESMPTVREPTGRAFCRRSRARHQQRYTDSRTRCWFLFALIPRSAGRRPNW